MRESPGFSGKAKQNKAKQKQNKKQNKKQSNKNKNKNKNNNNNNNNNNIAQVEDATTLEPRALLFLFRHVLV
jgi:hypothetical protein